MADRLTTLRYALAFKGLPFRTEWVEYPDVEALCKKIGAKPTEKKDDGRDHYTFPVIYDPNRYAQVFAYQSWPIRTLYPPAKRAAPC